MVCYEDIALKKNVRTQYVIILGLWSHLTDEEETYSATWGEYTKDIDLEEQ